MVNFTPEQIMLISALLGQVLPPFIDLINKWITNSKVRFLISLVVALIVGVVLSLPNLMVGNLDEMLESATIVWVSAQTAYNLYYGHSRMQTRIRQSNKIIPGL